MDFDSLVAVKSGLGTAAVIVMDKTVITVDRHEVIEMTGIGTLCRLMSSSALPD